MEYFRFFDTRIAEAVTLSGQMIIKFTIKIVNEYLNNILKTENGDYVVISDTDSVGVSFNQLVNIKCQNRSTKEIVEYLKNFDEKIFSKFLDDAMKQFGDHYHHYKKTLYMKRESVCRKTVVLAKKKYFSSIYAKEGVSFNYPKIEVKGVESVRSSTPTCCCKRLKNILKLILLKNESDVQNYIRMFKMKYDNIPFNEIAIPTGVSNLEKSEPNNGVFPKHTPIYVRAAHVFNMELKRLHLTTKYDPIHSGDKVKYCYLKMPNVLGNNVIGVKDVLPEELGLDEFVDRKKMFQKTFLNTVDRILAPVGWKSKKEETLKDFICI